MIYDMIKSGIFGLENTGNSLTDIHYLILFSPCLFFFFFLFILSLFLVLTLSLTQIEGVDPDNARVVVKLAIGSKTVTIIQHSLKLVTRKEYDKYSKDLSKSKSSSVVCELFHCHFTFK